MAGLGASGIGMAAIVISAVCAPGAVDAASRGPKRSAVTGIIIHATGGPFCERGKVAFSPAGTTESIKRFFERSSAVSIHYIIGPDGEVAKSVPEDEVAFHAVDHNDSSVGIELINSGDGVEPYPEKQIAALRELVAGVQKRWRIPASEVKGHEDVDRSTFSCGGRTVRRKQDPGPLFPWDRFRQELRLAERAR